MLIADSQVHLWEGASPRRTTPLGAQEMLREMDASGVGRAIIVPPLWGGHRNDFALATAAAHPGRFAVMGLLDPLAGESRGRIRDWLAQPGMLGLRFAMHRPELEAPLVDRRMEWIWREAERAQVPVCVLVRHPLMHEVDALARRYPGLRITVDHLGLAGEVKDEAAFRDLDAVLALAARPNVSAKVSALPCHTSEAFPFKNLHTYIRRAFDAFGPRRLFWGTDFSRSRIPYREHVTLFTEELSWLHGDDLEWIMGRGVCEWLGWD